MDGSYTGAGAHLKYRLNLEDTNHAIQTFYAGPSNVYTLQRVGNDSILSRCAIQSDGETAVQAEASMILQGFGHSQILQYFEHGADNTPYFWVGTRGALTDQGSTTEWPTQLGRVHYVSGATLDYTATTRLISARYIGGASFSHILRVEGALSSDKSTLMVIGIDTEHPRHAQFAIYDNEAINNILDTVDGSGDPTIGFDDSRVNASGVRLGTFPVSSVYPLSQYDSIQGTELADNNAIYFSASASEKNAIAISKMNWGAQSSEHQVVDNMYWTSRETEGEGIQLSGDDVLIGICLYPDGSTGSARDNRIYSFPKSAF